MEIIQEGAEVSGRCASASEEKEMNRTAIGRNIYMQLLKHDMSQRDLAEKINVTEVTMSRWINGIRQPTAYGLYRMAKVLGVSMEELMEEIEDEG